MEMQYLNPNTNKLKLTSVFGSENTDLVVFSIFVFFIPLAFHSTEFHIQLIVGSFVNMLLASSALYLSFKKTLPIILLPSIAAVASGFIFGPLSIFLLYLVPFIWVSNALYVYFIKHLKLAENKNYIFSVLTASTIKSIFLLISTLALIYFGIVPEIFLIPMSIVQFVTASIGGSATGIILVLKK